MSKFRREWNASDSVSPQNSSVKNLYTEQPSVSLRSAEEVRKFREDNDITMSTGAPNPVMSFEESGFPPYILQSLSFAGFSKPTGIQSQAWPVALSGKDMIGIAHTGSGKTLAFLLPALVHINEQSSLSSSAPTVLVLSPTRELAMQTSQECVRFGRPCNIKTVCVYGGASRSEQFRNLQRGAHIIIATPGRLIDFMDQQVISLQKVSYLVLDEADRMLDMGFEPQIRKIIGEISDNRQTLMWSATWPREVQNLAREFLKNPLHIQIGSLEVSANANIKQVIQVVENGEKFEALKNLLETIGESKVVVFVETKIKCEDLRRKLRDLKLSAVSMHGDKSQRDRDTALAEFRRKGNRILVATDVAARGLDVKDVQYVINFDFPGQLEDYVHRIGRTARAGAQGTAVSFFSSDNARMTRDLIEILRKANQDIPKELYGLMRNSRNNRNYRSRSPRRDFKFRGNNFRQRETGNYNNRFSSREYGSRKSFDDRNSSFRNGNRSTYERKEDRNMGYRRYEGDSKNENKFKDWSWGNSSSTHIDN